MSNCNKDESVWQLHLWSQLRAILRFFLLLLSCFELFHSTNKFCVKTTLSLSLFTDDKISRKATPRSQTHFVLRKQTLS